MRAITAILLAATALSAQTQPKADVGTAVKDTVIDFYDSISDYFRQSSRSIHLLSEKGIADLEIPAVLFIARRSSASPNQIVEAKKSGKAWEDIARQHGVKFDGNDLVAHANTVFLSQYHGRTPEEIRALRSKGASFIDINQQFRRVGTQPRSTEKARTQ
jgi:hypothetical protein